MENLDFGNIAIGAVIVGVLNLAIVVLTKTETILKIIERIKGIVGLDYRNRAKRSDDELRIMKKHEQVARERVRHSFVTMERWDCNWNWNWSEDFEPINIKGYCIGDRWVNPELYGTDKVFECSHPVSVDLYQRKGKPMLLCIVCSQEGVYPHRQFRAEFATDSTFAENPDEVFQPIISKAILSERDLRIAKEIKRLRGQFWR